MQNPELSMVSLVGNHRQKKMNKKTSFFLCWGTLKEPEEPCLVGVPSKFFFCFREGFVKFVDLHKEINILNENNDQARVTSCSNLGQAVL